MGKKLSEAQRQEIIDLLPSGKSCNQIAKDTGRGKTTVHRIARDVGHKWGQSNLERAREARKWYCAESRAMIAARLEDEANQLLDDLHKPYLAFNFGGKENDYNEHHFDEPPTESKFTIMRAVQAAVRTVTEIIKVDNASDDETQNRIAEFKNALSEEAAQVWKEPCES